MWLPDVPVGGVSAPGPRGIVKRARRTAKSDATLERQIRAYARAEASFSRLPILSDALESVVHLGATGMAAFSLWYARQNFWYAEKPFWPASQQPASP